MTYNEIYKACDEHTKNAISRNGSFYVLIDEPKPFSGNAKKFVVEHALTSTSRGFNYNGYGYEDNENCYYLSSDDADAYLELKNSKKSKKSQKAIVEPVRDDRVYESDEWKDVKRMIDEYNTLLQTKREQYVEPIVSVKEYSDDEISAFESSCSYAVEYNDVWNCILQLGRLNESAHKGYRELLLREELYNRKVYDLKPKYIEILRVKWQNAGGEFHVTEGVAYFVDKYGVQVSFHRSGQCDTYPSFKWNGVRRAWWFAMNGNTNEYHRIAGIIQGNKERELNIKRKKHDIESAQLRLILSNKDIAKYILTSGYTLVDKRLGYIEDYGYNTELWFNSELKTKWRMNEVIDKYGLHIKVCA